MSLPSNIKQLLRSSGRNNNISIAELEAIINEILAIGGGSANQIKYDATGETGGNLVADKTDLQAAVKEARDWLNEPVQKLTTFDDSGSIIVNGSARYSNIRSVTASTLTLTASDIDGNVGSALSSEHKEGNYLRVRYNFSQDCTITLVGFDSTANNTGTITPIPSGTYDFYFIADTFGVILVIPNNTTSTINQLTSPANFTAIPGDTEVSLSWNAVANATSYLLEFHTGDFVWSNVPGYSSGTSATHSSLTNGITVFYRVKARASGYTDSAYSTTSATPNGGAARQVNDTGSNNYFSGISSLFNITTDFSVSMWTKFIDSPFSGAHIFGKRNGSNIEWVIDCGASPFLIRAYVSGSTTGIATSAVTPSTNTWYHVYMQYNFTTKKVGISIDNAALVESTAITGNPNTNLSSIYFGRRSTDGVSISEVLDEHIEDIFIWNRLLTTTERTWLYAKNKYSQFGTGDGANLATSLISAYECNEASGNLLDSHGSNNLTETGTCPSVTGF